MNALLLTIPTHQMTDNSERGVGGTLDSDQGTIYVIFRTSHAARQCTMINCIREHQILSSNVDVSLWP